jgi:hypothetical protein
MLFYYHWLSMRVSRPAWPGIDLDQKVILDAIRTGRAMLQEM